METNAGTGWPQIMMLIGSIFLFLLYRSKYRCQHRLSSSCGGLCYGCCLPTVWKKEGQKSTGISAFNCRCSMKNCSRLLDCFSNKALHYYMQPIWSLRLNKLNCFESRKIRDFTKMRIVSCQLASYCKVDLIGKSSYPFPRMWSWNNSPLKLRFYIHSYLYKRLECYCSRSRQKYAYASHNCCNFLHKTR